MAHYPLNSASVFYVFIAYLIRHAHPSPVASFALGAAQANPLLYTHNPARLSHTLHEDWNFSNSERILPINCRPHGDYSLNGKGFALKLLEAQQDVTLPFLVPHVIIIPLLYNHNISKDARKTTNFPAQVRLFRIGTDQFQFPQDTKVAMAAFRAADTIDKKVTATNELFECLKDFDIHRTETEWLQWVKFFSILMRLDPDPSKNQIRNLRLEAMMQFNLLDLSNKARKLREQGYQHKGSEQLDNLQKHLFIRLKSYENLLNESRNELKDFPWEDDNKVNELFENLKNPRNDHEFLTSLKKLIIKAEKSNVESTAMQKTAATAIMCYLYEVSKLGHSSGGFPLGPNEIDAVGSMMEKVYREGPGNFYEANWERIAYEMKHYPHQERELPLWL
ncbi:hypothetical protein O181_025361 [Austropuccinia psidii MF-1]|uniref:Uncharacterized protein n=1 Tax=Austropuccinia psidii MF-1 TaxID=1389203 RepID=A0A9Q3CN99_9BASI|nr:hypothetical protein [Austropuccinia psidii MF-1]